MTRIKLVDIECRLIAGDWDQKEAIPVTDGTEVDDARGLPRLKWFWLPKSLVEIDEPDRDGNVTATMPEWLAKEKGLI